MLPLAQFYISNLPFVHPNIKNTKIMTVFISKDLPEPLEPMGEKWIIKEYDNLDEIVLKQINHPSSHLKPFPLKPQFV